MNTSENNSGNRLWLIVSLAGSGLLLGAAITILAFSSLTNLLSSETSESDVDETPMMKISTGLDPCEVAIASANYDKRIEEISVGSANNLADNYRAWAAYDTDERVRAMNIPAEVVCLMADQYNSKLAGQDGTSLYYGYTETMTAGAPLDPTKVRFLIYPTQIDSDDKPAGMSATSTVIVVTPELGWYLPCPEYCF